MQQLQSSHKQQYWRFENQYRIRPHEGARAHSVKCREAKIDGLDVTPPCLTEKEVLRLRDVDAQMHSTAIGGASVFLFAIYAGVGLCTSAVRIP
jgi:hypothetical protein